MEPPRKKQKTNTPHRKRALELNKSDNLNELLRPLKQLKIEQKTAHETDGDRLLSICKTYIKEYMCDLDRALSYNRSRHVLYGTHTPTITNPLPINLDVGSWYGISFKYWQLLQHNTYPHVDMMTSIIKIVLNIHDDKCGYYEVNSVVRMYTDGLHRIFSTHIPHSKNMRNIYGDFLIKPSSWIGFLGDETEYPECGLFMYLLNLLESEIKADSVMECNNQSDDDVQFMTLQEREIHKLRYETYKNLPRNVRIQRLFLILDKIVYLLENDFATWVIKHKSKLYKERKTKYTEQPLLLYIMFPENDCSAEINFCKRIFNLYLMTVKLDFPPKNIMTLSKLNNLISYTFYLRDRNKDDSYPKIGNHCIIYAERMFEVLKGEHLPCIIRTINYLRSKFMQYLLSYNTLILFSKSKKKNYRDVMIDVLQNQIWNTFPGTKTKLKKDENLKQLLQNNTCAIPRTYKCLSDIEPKKDKVCRSSFSLICFYSFKYFLELHGIPDIKMEFYGNSNLITDSMSTIYKINNLSYIINLRRNIFSNSTDIRLLPYEETNVYQYDELIKTAGKIFKTYYSIKNKSPEIELFFKYLDIGI